MPFLFAIMFLFVSIMTTVCASDWILFPIVDKFGAHAVLVTDNGLYGELVGFVTKHRIHDHADAE